MTSKENAAGFTLLEIVIGVAIFAMMAAAIYQSYGAIVGLVTTSRQKIVAVGLANELFEVVRNMPYADVGIIDGLPVGNMEREKTYSRSGTDYQVVATVRNIDDAFDGTIGGSPNDTRPADYKMVQFDISCASCRQFRPFSVTSYVAPKSLEMSTGNGALFVEVLNAAGEPVQGAEVTVANAAADPASFPGVTPSGAAVDIAETTNNAGMLQIVDIPPGENAYAVTVRKDGYSSEMTYLPGAAANPLPVYSHPTVTAENRTDITLFIDLVGSIGVRTIDDSCAALPSVPFVLNGGKVIGGTTPPTDPDMYKYREELATGADGALLIEDLEWDDYTLTAATEPLFYLPAQTFALAPAARKDAVMVFASGETLSPSLLVSIKNEATGAAIENAAAALVKDAIPAAADAECVPAGFFFFPELESAEYQLSVTAEGYDDFTAAVTPAASWQALDVLMTPAE